MVSNSNNECAACSKVSDVVICVSTPKGKETLPHKRLQSPTKSCSSAASTCRICHDGEGVGNLIAPCECTGTVAMVHKKCLETWLSTSNTDYCEICKFQFKIQRESRPLKQWLNSEPGPPGGPFGIFSDALCVLLLTPLCFFSFYLCTIGALSYYARGFWPGVGLAIVGFCVIIAYGMWVYMTIRFHIRCIRIWRHTNPVIRLENSAAHVASPYPAVVN